MPRLIVLDAVGDPFVTGLRRAWDAGDAVLPLDPRLPGPARASVLAAARPDDPVEAGDALVVATSGTDGEPKLAVLTHDAVLASALATSDRLGVDPDADRWLACLPLAHVGGLSVVTRAIVTGTPCTVHERFDVDGVQAAARRGLHVDLPRPDDPRPDRPVTVPDDPRRRPGPAGRSTAQRRGHLRHDRDRQRCRLRRPPPRRRRAADRRRRSDPHPGADAPARLSRRLRSQGSGGLVPDRRPGDPRR